MDDEGGLRAQITSNLIHKANIQQQVFDNTFAVFEELKEILHEMSGELDDELDEKLDKRIRIEYRDRGKFEAQIQVAGDVVIFSMHTNVFSFDRDHAIWQNPYVGDDRLNSYCGLINIYNFLADSFKFNRNADEGYLIGRLFVNRNMDFFVEGKQQTSVTHAAFGSERIDKAAIVRVVEAAVAYALDFDLLAPPYDTMKVVSVDQMNTKIENSKMTTGKRLGYEFKTDDI